MSRAFVSLPTDRVIHGAGALADLSREMDRLGLRRAFEELRPGNNPRRVESADEILAILADAWCGVHDEEHSMLSLSRVISADLTFIDDVDGIRLRESIGADRIMWSSDFPHLDSGWPESRRFLDKHLADVPRDEAELIVAGTCRRLYHLE